LSDCAFMPKEGSFSFQTPVIPAEFAVLPYDAMAWG